jgi:hypothetical protein
MRCHHLPLLKRVVNLNSNKINGTLAQQQYPINKGEDSFSLRKYYGNTKDLLNAKESYDYTNI